MQKVRMFVKNQTVLSIAALLAAASMLFVPPSAAYLGYLNADTLILLFSLMAAVSGLRICGVFQKLAQGLTKKCSTARLLALVMLLVCFFSSMFITNDVALLTFVPVTLLIYSGKTDADAKKALILTVVLETAAANLGSMILPTGNPQNIYLCSYYSISMGTLIKTLLPFGLLALMLLCLTVLLIPKLALYSVNTKSDEEYVFSWKTTICCAIIFVLALLTVSKVISAYVCLIAAILLTLIADKHIFAKVDYFLLMTFVCFFVFTGNLGSMDAVRELLSKCIGGRELPVSIIASQVFSNVPAALLLSNFTDQAKLLLIGVNLGGLGTPIASLASLISYQLYAKEQKSGGKYMKTFFVFNFGFLALMSVSAMFFG